MAAISQFASVSGLVIEPANNGGWVVYARAEGDMVSPILAAVTNDEDLKSFLAGWLANRAEPK